MFIRNFKEMLPVISEKASHTLEFQIEGEGGINGEAGKIWPK